MKPLGREGTWLSLLMALSRLLLQQHPLQLHTTALTRVFRLLRRIRCRLMLQLLTRVFSAWMEARCPLLIQKRRVVGAWASVTTRRTLVIRTDQVLWICGDH